jgi:ABC-type branched-subunit amino acid transport system substrate-binding protein
MRTLLIALALGASCSLAAADILIGQTSGFSGPVAAGVKETTDGAKLYLDHVNRHGGVHGQRIELASLDDKFDPRQSAVNAQMLIDRGALALFLNRGTPHTEAIAPLLDKHHIALVAPSTGAMILHEPVNPWIFNVRAPYQRETEKAVVQLASMSLTRIALVHVDDSFGNDCTIGAARGFEKANLKPVVEFKFDRAKPDFAPVAAGVAKANAQAVIFIGAAGAVVDGTKAIRAKGSRAQIVTVSNNASAGFVSQMGAFAHGTVVTQVFPAERSLGAPLVKEAYDLAKAKGMNGVTPAMLEGYAGAKVLVEGLRRAGPNPTRQKVRDALEGMNRYDLGGLEVSYGPRDHTGLEYSDLSIIGPNGKFQR